MPYIGNSHITGDHTNNFKVLDDLTSHTATFDGSSSSVIDTTSNTIRVVEHRFIQGQRVTYTNGGGGNIGGLTTGTAYFVIFDTASTFKLATSASNAANSVAINLSAAGTGSSHTLNAAFDGVNTKFKITYNGGTGARFNNATQLNIAINVYALAVDALLGCCRTPLIVTIKLSLFAGVCDKVNSVVLPSPVKVSIL